MIWRRCTLVCIERCNNNLVSCPIFSLNPITWSCLFLSSTPFFHTFAAETGYGNIIKGWDTFVSTTDIRAAASSRKAKVSDRDRIFTLSSVNYTPESEIPEMEDDDLGGGDEGIGNKRKRLGRYYD